MFLRISPIIRDMSSDRRDQFACLLENSFVFLSCSMMSDTASVLHRDSVAHFFVHRVDSLVKGALQVYLDLFGDADFLQLQ